MATREDIISSVSNRYSDAIAPKKKDTLKNADPGNHRDLMQYNAILDHIALGAHTKTTISRYGREWNFRLITADEQDKLQLEILKSAKIDDCFEDSHLNYLMWRKVIALALTPSPFKTTGKDEKGDDILTEQDLRHLPLTCLNTLYKEYMYFVDMALVEAEDMPESDAIALIDMVKKKPEVKTELNRQQLLTVLHYYQNCLQALEEIRKSEQTN